MWAQESEPAEARFYTIEDGAVRCDLCAHSCRITEGNFGVCQVRQNLNGRLVTHVYGTTISQAVDPIEKKPLYHFFPGTKAYSIATPGCNFRCEWCQNWQISQMPREQGAILGRPAAPKQIVRAALDSGSRSIAYTYTEPTIFGEFAFDISGLAHKEGLANVFVTNGYMSADFLAAYAPLLDAANVDLKAFRDETYRRFVGARLQPVLDSMKRIKEHGIWLEVTTLVIPGINDEPVELREAANFIAVELGMDTPWHISRFHPGYKMHDRAATPVETLIQARDIGLEEGLHHIYIGNVFELDTENTTCSSCGHVLLQRAGYRIEKNALQDGCCPQCGSRLAGVFS
ncbi:MAG: AmmeMemoRadiSam system radical SAM enzyme [Anaerolineales bacterium]|nr:AmmeMemoRadiSam system radical SAM enzyme [Anaerolineales bacterium]